MCRDHTWPRRPCQFAAGTVLARTQRPAPAIGAGSPRPAGHPPCQGGQGGSGISGHGMVCGRTRRFAPTNGAICGRVTDPPLRSHPPYQGGVGGICTFGCVSSFGSLAAGGSPPLAGPERSEQPKSADDFCGTTAPLCVRFGFEKSNPYIRCYCSDLCISFPKTGEKELFRRLPDPVQEFKVFHVPGPQDGLLIPDQFLQADIVDRA